LLDPARHHRGLLIGRDVDWFHYLLFVFQGMIMNNNDTTLEVVDDDGAAWRECGPDGCTTSRSTSPSSGSPSQLELFLETQSIV
jgi:hypothetical protein